MAKPLGVRRWATPLTLGSFVLMASTGVLMFFELDRGLTTVVHQWFSWFFLLGAGGHMLANLEPLKRHLASTRGRASVALFALVSLASFPSWGLLTGPQLKRPIEAALVDAPLSSLAAVAHRSEADLLGALQAHGIAASARQSARELAASSGVDPNELLGLVFVRDR